MFKQRLALGLGAIGTLMFVGVGPVQAATSGHLTAPVDGVLYDDCRDVGVPYSLTLDPGTDYWNLSVVAYGPDGTEEASDYVYSSDYPSTGTAYLQFCGGEDPGTYTVKATGETSDDDANSSDRQFALPAVAFGMRQPHSATTLTRRYKRGANLLTVGVSDERPNGYFPTKYADLQLQVLKRGTWRTISRTSATTDTLGRHVYRVRRTPKVAKVRAITNADIYYDGSASNPVRLR